MDCEIFIEWVHSILVPGVKEHLREKDLPQTEKIFLLDNCRGHPLAECFKSGNHLCYISGANVTRANFIHPTDQGVVQNKKMN